MRPPLLIELQGLGQQEFLAHGLLERLEGGQAMRDDAIWGSCFRFPAVGESFAMAAESKDPTMSLRGIETSPVAEIVHQSDDIWVFRTASGSVYRFNAMKVKEDA